MITPNALMIPAMVRTIKSKSRKVSKADRMPCAFLIFFASPLFALSTSDGYLYPLYHMKKDSSSMLLILDNLNKIEYNIVYKMHECQRFRQS